MPVVMPKSAAVPIAIPKGGDYILAVPYFTQNPWVNLCWAACCEMVLAYNHISIPGALNGVTGTALGRNCTDLSKCNVSCWPEVAYSRLRFNCSRWNRAFTMDEILHEITANRPIHAMFQWDGGNTHVVTVAGCFANGDLLVLDPQRGRAQLSYEYLESAYGQGQWAVTYFYLQPHGASA